MGLSSALKKKNNKKNSSACLNFESVPFFSVTDGRQVAAADGIC